MYYVTGKFKSGLLLNLADQIRRFNPQIQAVENGVRKTIVDEENVSMKR